MEISLLMVTSDGQGKDLPPLKLPVTIGRAEDCKLRVPLAAVSRHHCELVEDDDELLIRDLKSSNGTFVNKERVVRDRELVPGDLISVGPIVFVVRIDGHPRAIDPIISYANGAVLTGESGGGGEIDGVPTWSGSPASVNPTPASGTPARPAASQPAAQPPAPKMPPAPPKAKKDDSSFESLLADLSESDFDIDLSGDDDPKPKKK